MLGGDQVNVVHSSCILQFDVPLRQLLWRKVKAIALMCDIMVLTEGTAKIASRKEHRSAAIVALDTRFCSWLVSNALVERARLSLRHDLTDVMYVCVCMSL